jgi:hypothetical protein
MAVNMKSSLLGCNEMSLRDNLAFQKLSLPSSESKCKPSQKLSALKVMTASVGALLDPHFDPERGGSLGSTRRSKSDYHIADIPLIDFYMQVVGYDS